MESYFRFFDAHPVAAFRLFFAIIILVDFFFIYAAIFDRQLFPRIAKWFLEVLLGQHLTMAPSAGPIAWWQWIGFWLASSAPLLAWVAYEVFIVPRSG